MKNYILPEISSGLTKKQIMLSAQNAVDDLLQNGNVLAAAEAIAAMENFIKEVKADKRYTEYVREQISINEKCFTSPSGTKIELSETGTKYDFSQCNDSILVQLETELTTLEEKVKIRKEFLKTVPVEGLSVLNENSGEVAIVYPPSKTSTSSYKVTLAK